MSSVAAVCDSYDSNQAITSTVTNLLESDANYRLEQIGAHDAYALGYFGQSVTVGVVDTGVHTTHIDLTANLVPGRRADSSGNLYADINDAEGHGTFVAGIIGAAINNTLTRGVAPSASIMPLQFGNTTNGDLDGEPLALFNYAATSGVHILNNSWGPANIVTGTYEGEEYLAEIPLLGPLFDYYGGFYVNGFGAIAATVGSADMVFAWAAGNDYWHEGANIDMLSTVSGVFRTISQNDFINGFTEVLSGGQSIVFSTLNLDPNDPGGYAWVPVYEPGLLGRWVHVVAVDDGNNIAGFSNGCGNETKYWCLAAPGVMVGGIDSASNTAFAVGSGTSFSAPHVAGALAVLKSRHRDMPMSVILTILFATATDLGVTGVDDVYGHGLLNLARAITIQNSASLVIDAASGNNSLISSRLRLPPVLSAMQSQLKTVLVAVGYLPGNYYNTPLANLVDSDVASVSSLGDAAADMLAISDNSTIANGLSLLQHDGNILGLSHENKLWRLSYDVCATCDSSVWESYQSTEIAAPFFASSRQGMSFAAKFGKLYLFAAAGLGDNAKQKTYEQYGFRWHYGRNAINSGDSNNVGGLLEFSLTDEEGALYGGEYTGAFALSGAKTYQGRIRSERRLADGWLSMADYQFGWTDTEVGDGGIITDISRLGFDGWRLGVEGNTLFGKPLVAGGLIRIGMTRESAVRFGTMRLRYGVSDENSEGGYNIEDREFSLATKPMMTYHWGYSLTPRDNMRAAFGVEYNTGGANENDNRAISLLLNWSF